MRACWLMLGACLVTGCTAPRPAPPETPFPPTVEHYVRLGWGPSPTQGYIVYRVYRAECAGQLVDGACELPETFVKVSGEVGALEYKDPSVTSGVRYVYEVTAFDGTLESDPSKQVSVQIP